MTEFSPLRLASALQTKYYEWCRDPRAAILVAPLDPDAAGDVLADLTTRATTDRHAASGCPAKIVLSGHYASGDNYPNMWSVFGPGKATYGAAMDWLSQQGMHSFAIAGQRTQPTPGSGDL